MRKSIVFVALLFLASPLLAQHDNYVLRNYSAIDGLPQSQVYCLAEDTNGYLWVGTAGGGLARFDGHEFKVFTTLDGLLNNTVLDIKIDSHCNLWIAHPRGVSRYDGVSFKSFRSSSHPSASKMVRRIHLFKDTVFVFSAPGVVTKIFNDSVYYWNRELKPKVFVNRVYPLPGGELFLFMSDGSIKLKTSAGMQTIDQQFPRARIHQLYTKGDTAIVTFYLPDEKTPLTFRIDVATNSLVPYNSTINQFVCLWDGVNNNYWTLDGNNVVVRKNATDEGKVILSDVDVSLVYPDREGNYWIGTSGNGLYKYHHQDFSRCSSDNMRGVMSIFKASNNTRWIGTMNKGLWKISNGKFKSFSYDKEPARNSINTIVESPDGTIWIGTRGGLGKYNEEKEIFEWFTPAEGLSGYSVLNINFDKAGNLWIGTNAGLSFFDGKKFTTYRIENGLLANMISSAFYHQADGKLFVGSEFGINTISNGNISKLTIRGFENASVLCIQPYRDSLILFGSGGAGFAIFSPQTYTSHLITTRQGLQSDFIYFVAQDDEGYIWAGTEKGINRLLLNNSFEVVENLAYDHNNGLQGVETNQNAFYLSPKEKFFGLIDGLYQFNEQKNTNQQSFALHLTGIDIFYGEESARNFSDSLFGAFNLPYNPVFPHDKNHLTFSFNRVDKRYGKSIRFKYRIKNYDKAWSQPTVNKSVTYSNIPPGEYEFELMATDSRGSWSPVKINYPFTIKAPFYQTASFIFTCVGAIIVLSVFFFFWRLRKKVEHAMMLERIREQENENLRKDIARDFHDEMGNQLSRIINYVSLLKLNGKANVNGEKHHQDLYTKVEDSAKYLYTGTRDFIWSIDPVNDELSKLFLHIRDFGEKLFEEKGIQFRAFNSVKGKVKLPYGFSREANLIFKEVMTNAFKSSQATNASLSLERVGDNYEMCFKDDGVGFNLPEIENSNGLKNIRDRADKLGAILRITSKPENGTCISLVFKPIKKKQYGTTI